MKGSQGGWRHLRVNIRCEGAGGVGEGDVGAGDGGEGCSCQEKREVGSLQPHCH